MISAGSFLYIATLHILPEVLSNSNDHHGHNFSEEKNMRHKKEKHGMGKEQVVTERSKGVELAVMIAGLVAPLALTYLQDA